MLCNISSTGFAEVWSPSLALVFQLQYVIRCYAEHKCLKVQITNLFESCDIAS